MNDQFGIKTRGRKVGLLAEENAVDTESQAERNRFHLHLHTQNKKRTAFLGAAHVSTEAEWRGPENEKLGIGAVWRILVLVNDLHDFRKMGSRRLR